MCSIECLIGRNVVEMCFDKSLQFINIVMSSCGRFWFVYCFGLISIFFGSASATLRGFSNSVDGIDIHNSAYDSNNFGVPSLEDAPNSYGSIHIQNPLNGHEQGMEDVLEDFGVGVGNIEKNALIEDARASTESVHRIKGNRVVKNAKVAIFVIPMAVLFITSTCFKFLKHMNDGKESRMLAGQNDNLCNLNRPLKKRLLAIHYGDKSQFGGSKYNYATDWGGAVSGNGAASGGVEIRSGDRGDTGDGVDITGSRISAAAFGDARFGAAGFSDSGYGDGGFGAASVGDVSVVDSSINDISVVDDSVVDASVVDASVGDVSVVDARVGDVSVGDVNVGDVNFGDVNAGDVNVDDVSVVDASVDRDVHQHFGDVVPSTSHTSVRFYRYEDESPLDLSVRGPGGINSNSAHDVVSAKDNHRAVYSYDYLDTNAISAPQIPLPIAGDNLSESIYSNSFTPVDFNNFIQKQHLVNNIFLRSQGILPKLIPLYTDLPHPNENIFSSTANDGSGPTKRKENRQKNVDLNTGDRRKNISAGSDLAWREQYIRGHRNATLASAMDTSGPTAVRYGNTAEHIMGTYGNSMTTTQHITGVYDSAMDMSENSVGTSVDTTNTLGPTVGAYGSTLGSLEHTMASSGNIVGTSGHSMGTQGHIVGKSVHTGGTPQDTMRSTSAITLRIPGSAVGSLGNAVGTSSHNMDVYGHATGTLGQTLLSPGNTMGILGGSMDASGNVIDIAEKRLGMEWHPWHVQKGSRQRPTHSAYERTIGTYGEISGTNGKSFASREKRKVRNDENIAWYKNTGEIVDGSGQSENTLHRLKVSSRAIDVVEYFLEKYAHIIDSSEVTDSSTATHLDSPDRMRGETIAELGQREPQTSSHIWNGIEMVGGHADNTNDRNVIYDGNKVSANGSQNQTLRIFEDSKKVKQSGGKRNWSNSSQKGNDDRTMAKNSKTEGRKDSGRSTGSSIINIGGTGLDWNNKLTVNAAEAQASGSGVKYKPKMTSKDGAYELLIGNIYIPIDLEEYKELVEGVKFVFVSNNLNQIQRKSEQYEYIKIGIRNILRQDMYKYVSEYIIQSSERTYKNISDSNLILSAFENRMSILNSRFNSFKEHPKFKANLFQLYSSNAYSQNLRKITLYLRAAARAITDARNAVFSDLNLQILHKSELDDAQPLTANGNNAKNNKKEHKLNEESTLNNNQIGILVVPRHAKMLIQQEGIINFMRKKRVIPKWRSSKYDRLPIILRREIGYGKENLAGIDRSLDELKTLPKLFEGYLLEKYISCYLLMEKEYKLLLPQLVGCMSPSTFNAIRQAGKKLSTISSFIGRRFLTVEGEDIK